MFREYTRSALYLGPRQHVTTSNCILPCILSSQIRSIHTSIANGPRDRHTALQSSCTCPLARNAASPADPAMARHPPFSFRVSLQSRSGEEELKLDLVQPGVSNELRCIIFLFPVETETVTCTWQPPVKPRVLIGPEKKRNARN